MINSNFILTTIAVIMVVSGCGRPQVPTKPTLPPLQEDVPYFKGKIPDRALTPTHEGKDFVYYFNFSVGMSAAINEFGPDLLNQGFKLTASTEKSRVYRKDADNPKHVTVFISDGEQAVKNSEDPVPGKGSVVTLFVFKP